METVDYHRLIFDASKLLKDDLINYPQISKPRVLIVCGSGLGGIGELLDKDLRLEKNYVDIPGFKSSTVSGHRGKLIFGLIGTNKVPVMCMLGRLHFYEGYSFQETTFPIRLAKELGVESVFLTNAAGGTNSNLKPGDLMLINDHINFPGLAGYHPLRGPNMDTYGPRFLPLSDAYDFDLRRLFITTAKNDLKISRKISEGTYFFAAGPTYESRAEVRMIRAMGGDAVGMSTVPEVIIARHCNLRVLALSLITNAGLGDPPSCALDDDPKSLDAGMANHEEVLEAAKEAASDVQKIVEATINKL